jgi:hypothetical protein
MWKNTRTNGVGSKHAMKNFVLQFERLILKNTDLARNLCIYINHYRMDGVQSLFERFEIDLKKNIDEEEEELKQEIESGKWNLSYQRVPCTCRLANSVAKVRAVQAMGPWNPD